MKALGLALRIGLGALLVYAGALKLGAPATFADDIANYHLLPVLAPLLAATLPAVEIVCGLALVLLPARWRTGAALLAVVLMAMFTVAVGSAWLRGIDVRCGCFGTGGGPVDGLTVARDALFVLWALAVLLLARRENTPG